jgi:hypothetical protein
VVIHGEEILTPSNSSAFAERTARIMWDGEDFSWMVWDELSPLLSRPCNYVWVPEAPQAPHLQLRPRNISMHRNFLHLSTPSSFYPPKLSTSVLHVRLHSISVYFGLFYVLKSHHTSWLLDSQTFDGRVSELGLLVPPLPTPYSLQPQASAPSHW